MSFADPLDFFQHKVVPESSFVEKNELFMSEFEPSRYEKLFVDLFVRFGPIANTIEAFNQVLHKIIPRRLVGCLGTDASGTYSLTNIRIVKPMHEIEMSDGTRKIVPMFPRDARALGQSYSATIYAEVTRTVHHGISRIGGSSGMKTVSNFIVGTLPIMVGSSACHLDGYTKEELRAVGEDGTPFDKGYFIVNGGERIVVNQETLGTNQIFSHYDNKNDIYETRLTTPSHTGTTVVSVTLEKDWHILKVSIHSIGLMGAQTVSYTLFAIFDVLFQLMDPENLGYDSILYPSKTSTPEHRFQIRDEIVRRSLEMIRLFVPEQHHSLISTFFVASTIEYIMSESPVKNVVSERLAKTNIGKASENAMLAAARRSAAAVVAGGMTDPTDTNISIEVIQQAAKVAAEAAERISQAPSEMRVKAMLVDLFKDLFSNTEELDFRMKAQLLARQVAQQMLVVSGVRPVDNRDSWANKRIKRPADDYAQTMNAYRMSISDQGFVRSSVANVIDRIFSAALSPNSGRDSKIQPHNRITPLALAGQITTIGTPVSKKSKQQEIRKVQATQTGSICPADTPCTDAIGLTKSIACTCWISLRRDEIKARQLISHLILSDNRTNGSPHPIFVDEILIGWGNSHETVTAMRQILKRNLEFFDVTVIWKPNDRCIEIHTVGGRPTRPLLVLDEESAIPLISDTLPEEFSIEDYITSGALEFVSSMEQAYSRIIERIEDIPQEIEKRSRIPKDKRDYPLYSEVNPLSLLGLSTSLMPLANASQGPRVTYQASMFKQALGQFHDSIHDRYDHSAKTSPGCRPFGETLSSAPLGMSVSPCGRPLIMAMKAEGENEEDGIVANYEAFSNLVVTKYQNKKATTRQIGNMSTPVGHSTGPGNVPAASMRETFSRPANIGPVGGKRYALYHAIESTGFPKIGSIISKGDCVIGIVRTYYDANGNKISTEDASELAGIGDEGVVDRVHVIKIDDDKLTAHVRLRQVRGVKPGDKLSSCQSQKGTITKFLSNYTSPMPGEAVSAEASETRLRALAAAGEGALREVLAAETTASASISKVEEVMTSLRFSMDLPIVATGPNRGMVPDILINPASETSRMTPCRQQELLSAKSSVYTGKRRNLSAFVPYMEKYYDMDRNILESEGLDGGGYETMMYPNGIRLHPSARIYMGPLYFLFLKHTVLDKVQTRNTGLNYPLQKQPTKGRSKGGGLKEGEMERNAFGSAGAANLLRTIMVYNSDVHEYEVCTTCGQKAIVNYNLGIYKCPKCPAGTENIGLHRIPFAKSLIDAYLAGAGIFSSMSGFKEVTRAQDPIQS